MRIMFAAGDPGMGRDPSCATAHDPSTITVDGWPCSPADRARHCDATADWKPKVLSVPGRSLSIFQDAHDRDTLLRRAWAIRRAVSADADQVSISSERTAAAVGLTAASMTRGPPRPTIGSDPARRAQDRPAGTTAHPCHSERR
jgi:hypothetical protein